MNNQNNRMRGGYRAVRRPGDSQTRRSRGDTLVRPLLTTLLAIAAFAAILIAARNAPPGALSFASDTAGPGEITAAVTEGETTAAAVSETPDELGDDVDAECVWLQCLSDGRTLAEKNPDELAYPASLTKIMTALVVLDADPDLSGEVKLDAQMFDYITKNAAATAGYVSGETVQVVDLMYGLLLPSGAECAIGLAKYVAGSESDFAALMNAKAKELGMTGTHYTNSSGLHDLNHYTTARDMATLLTAALKNETFYKIFTTQTYISNGTAYHPYGLVMTHTVFKAFTQAGLDPGYVIGGKTGYTDQAKQCMAVLAQKDGVSYVLIVMGCGDGTTSDNFHAKTVASLLTRYLGAYTAAQTSSDAASDSETVEAG